jgi:hypothetical protein
MMTRISYRDRQCEHFLSLCPQIIVSYDFGLLGGDAQRTFFELLYVSYDSMFINYSFTGCKLIKKEIDRMQAHHQLFNKKQTDRDDLVDMCTIDLFPEK